MSILCVPTLTDAVATVHEVPLKLRSRDTNLKFFQVVMTMSNDHDTLADYAVIIQSQTVGR